MLQSYIKAKLYPTLTNPFLSWKISNLKCAMQFNSAFGWTNRPLPPMLRCNKLMATNVSVSQLSSSGTKGFGRVAQQQPMIQEVDDHRHQLLKRWLLDVGSLSSKIVAGLWITSQSASTSPLEVLTPSWLTTSRWGKSVLGGCLGCSRMNKRPPELHCATKCWGVTDAKERHFCKRLSPWMSPDAPLWAGNKNAIQHLEAFWIATTQESSREKVGRQGDAHGLFGSRWLGVWSCSTSSHYCDFCILFSNPQSWSEASHSCQASRMLASKPWRRIVNREWLMFMLSVLLINSVVFLWVASVQYIENDFDIKIFSFSEHETADLC